MKKEKQKSLEEVLKDMQAKHGKGSVTMFGDNLVRVERVPSSSMNLTDLLGGGYPRGRIIEVYGAESSGKTSLAELIAADFQNHYFKDTDRHGQVAFIDVEHAFDPDYAATIGVDLKRLVFSQPNSAEEALDITEELISNNVCDLIIVDSVAALTPIAEIDGEMGDQQMGVQAKLMSKACRKLNSVMNPTSATVIFINQLRSKIGVFYGNPNVPSGGNALKYFASIRLVTRLKETVEKNGKVVGIISHIKAIKNKVAPPFKECDIKLLFGKGYQVDEEYVPAFISKGLITRGGAWFTFSYRQNEETKEHKVQGIENLVIWFKENPQVFEDFKQKLKNSIKLESVVSEDTEEESQVIVQQTQLEKEALGLEEL